MFTLTIKKCKLKQKGLFEKMRLSSIHKSEVKQVGSENYKSE